MLRVLYVDDEPDLLELAKLFLEETNNFTLDIDTSASHALDRIGIQTYDAIISDYQMPGMDGIAFLKAVRGQNREIPFILFTGRGREEVVIAAINNGADFYLQKGGDPKAQFAELAHKIRQAVARRQAETALHESRERLQRFMDSATDAFTIWDDGFNLVDLNRTALSYLPAGTKKEDVIGKNYLEFMPDSRTRGEYDRYLEVMKTGTPFIGTNMVPDPRYGRRWLNARVFRVGNGIGIVTTEITQQKNAEDELRAAYEQITASEEELRMQYDLLRKSEEELRLLKFSVDQSADEVFWLDFEGTILYVNDAACRINGYSREEFLKMKISELNPDITREIWIRSVMDLREKKTQLFTTRHLHKDGSIIDVEIMAVYVNQNDREYSFAYVRDITGRKRADDELRAQYDTLAATQAELQKQKQQLEEIANTVPGVIYQFYARPDGSMGLYYVSSRAPEVFGITGTLENFFERFTERVEPKDREAFLASVGKAVTTKAPWDFEGRYVKPSGETIWFQGISRPSLRGNEVVYSGVLLDITGRKKA